MQPLVLDTHAAIWISRDEPLASGAVEAMNAASASGTPVHVSPITAWEIGLLVSRGRLNLLMPPERWFASLLGTPGIVLAEMPPRVLIAASYLPGTPPNDPADRILAATARDLGARLVTRNRALLAYGAQGHLATVEC